MEEDVKSIGDYLSIGWRRKYYLIIPVILISIATIVVVKMLPSVYRSTGTILIESQQIPEEFIQSTVTGFAGERIQIIKQRIMTSRRLLPIIEKHGLIDELQENVPTTSIVENVRGRIFVDLISSNKRGRGALIAFNVAFEDQSPEVAQKVANELVTLFLDENLKTRKAKAGETTDFLQQEANRLLSDLEAIEDRIAQYRADNQGKLPENLAISLGRVDDLQRRLLELRRERTELTNNRVLLQIDLESAARSISPGVTASDQNFAEAELIRLENDFIRLSARYGAEHPDVKALKRQITAFRQQYSQSIDNSRIQDQIAQTEKELAEAQQKYTAEHPNIKRLVRTLDSLRAMNETPEDAIDPVEKRDNPQYLQISARLEAIDNRLGTLAVTEKELLSEIKVLNEKIRQTPQVQRGLDTLLRDYDSTRNEYQEMKAKQLQAELSMSLEENQKGERFTLLESPVLPTKPEKPDRMKLALMGFLISIFAGIGLVTVVESLDSGIYGARALAKVTHMTPLVSIPYIVTQASEKKRGKYLKIGILFAIILCIAGVMLIHLFYKPIDIMWFQLIQKFNLA